MTFYLGAEKSFKRVDAFTDTPFKGNQAVVCLLKGTKRARMIRRWQDIKNPGCVNQDPIFKQYNSPPNEVGYPGGIFNPLNFAPTLEAKEKEVASGKGPFENLLQHISDPWHNTIIQTLSGYRAKKKI